MFFGRIGLQRLATIRWLFIWGKGITLRGIVWGSCPDSRFLIDWTHSYSVCNRDPEAPIILLIWRPQFLILAGGGGGGPKINQVIGVTSI